MSQKISIQKAVDGSSFLNWASLLVQDYEIALTAFEITANDEFHFEQFVSISYASENAWRPYQSSNFEAEELVQHISLYLLSRALLEAVAGLPIVPNQVSLPSFNPIIFAAALIANADMRFPKLVVMPRPTRNSSQSVALQHILSWDLEPFSSDLPSFACTVLITNCSSQDSRELQILWPRVRVTRSNHQDLHPTVETTGETAWLTVVIPTCDHTRVHGAIQSIAEQRTGGVKILVLEKSESNLNESLSNLNKKNSACSPSIHSIATADRGAYDAMNLGIALCDTPWIYFLGDDDRLADHLVLKEIKSEISNSEFDSSIIYGNVEIRGAGHGTYDGQSYGYAFSYERLRSQNPCHQAIFYKTQFLRDHGGFNTKYPICADWDLNLRVWQNANPKFIDLVIALFKRGGLSSRKRDDLFFKDLPQTWATYQRAQTI